MPSARAGTNCWPLLAVPVEPLAKLGLLLGKNFQKALQVVGQNEVQCYQAEPSGRRIFEVRESQQLNLSKAQNKQHMQGGCRNTKNNRQQLLVLCAAVYTATAEVGPNASGWIHAHSNDQKSVLCM